MMCNAKSVMTHYKHTRTYTSFTRMSAYTYMLSHTSTFYLHDIYGADGRGASVSACAGLTNQLLSCWVDPRIAWKNHLHSNCRRPVDEGGRTRRPVLLTGAKKSHLGCLNSFELPMGFQNFIVINKIHSLKKINFIVRITLNVIQCGATPPL